MNILMHIHAQDHTALEALKESQPSFIHLLLLEQGPVDPLETLRSPIGGVLRGGLRSLGDFDLDLPHANLNAVGLALEK